VAAAIAVICWPLAAQGELHVLPAQGSVTMVATPAGNIAVQTGPEGPLVVDTLAAAMSARVLETVRTLSPRPIRHVVLTGGGAQQAGGAANLSKAGRYVRLIDNNDPRGADARASIIAHVNVLNRMSASGVTADSWPTDTYFTRDWALFSNGEAVQFIHAPKAATDGDTVVFFRRSDVIVTGAFFDTNAYPEFDPAAGGSIQGVIDGLNLVLDIAIPGENQEGGTVIIPGRGRLSDETDIANYRDMVTIVRDRVRDMVNKGVSLEQVRAAGVASEYDGLYDTRSDWTSARFVEAVYRDLTRSAQ
jgi:glyoxylase-like metal-dependent hydrolase (beta-lactamase superfamily II)